MLVVVSVSIICLCEVLERKVREMLPEAALSGKATISPSFNHLPFDKDYNQTVLSRIRDLHHSLHASHEHVHIEWWRPLL